MEPSPRARQSRKELHFIDQRPFQLEPRPLLPSQAGTRCSRPAPLFLQRLLRAGTWHVVNKPRQKPGEACEGLQLCPLCACALWLVQMTRLICGLQLGPRRDPFRRPDLEQRLQNLFWAETHLESHRDCLASQNFEFTCHPMFLSSFYCQVFKTLKEMICCYP